MCIFTLIAMGVNSFWYLCIIRFCVGFGGATFVVTEYWTTRMFASDIAGTANASDRSGTRTIRNDLERRLKRCAPRRASRERA